MSTKSDQVKGHAKSVAGIVTGNKNLQAEGDTETRTAQAAGHIDDARDKAIEVLDHLKDKIDDAADKAKDTLHKKPDHDEHGTRNEITSTPRSQS